MCLLEQRRCKMITYYKNRAETGLIALEEWEQNCWINVTTPTQAELQFITEKWDVPLDFLNDIEDVEERPRIELEDGWELVIMRIPIKLEEEMEFGTAPLGIITKNDVVLTICFQKNEVISDFVFFTQRKGIIIDNNINFLLRLFLSSSVWYQKYLKHINIRTKMAEKELEKSIRNDELQALLKIEKVLVYFITSLKGNDLLLYKMKNIQYKEAKYDPELMEDVEIELKQAMATTNIHTDILSSLMDSYASIISNNVNDIMKRLTTITIMLTLPNIVSGFFGMNVTNFLETNDTAFIVITVFTLVIIGIAFFIFKRAKYF